MKPISETVSVPEIMLPCGDFSKWAVIACDQFTGQPDYWKQLDAFVGSMPSTLRMILPEAYLAGADLGTEIKKINSNMQTYLDSGSYDTFKGFVLVERTLKNGQKRIGLMLAVNLDDYDYTQQNNALIKATEKTVVDRLPPRVKIRENAPLEIPHIMLLCDDPQKAVIEKIYESRDNLKQLYDFKLNMGGGHLRGWLVPEADFGALGDKNGFLFAVGDGNHSLAAAKECWELKKKALTREEQKKHPARFALCELVNLHDASLVFEPIHRVIFNGGQRLVDAMISELKGGVPLKIYRNGQYFTAGVKSNPADAIADIQNFLDAYAGIETDYIHGDAHLLSVADKNDGVAVFMPAIAKDGLFDYVARRGVLPRKSFSMGDAEDKRYYLEARRL